MSELEQPPERLAHSWVVFSVGGEDFNPDVISRELGVDPDRVFYPGKDGKGAMWQVSSSLPGEEKLEAHFWQILNRILPARKSLMKIARDASLNFHATIQKPTGSRYNLSLSPRLLILIGYIGAGVDVEILDLDPDNG